MSAFTFFPRILLNDLGYAIVGRRSYHMRGTHALTIESAVAIWEYLITLTNEVDIFWTKKLTATSLFFVVMRWIMLANTLVPFMPVTEATLDSIPLLCILQINISLSNCKALTWASEILYLAGYTGIACKQARFTVTVLLCDINNL